MTQRTSGLSQSNNSKKLEEKTSSSMSPSCDCYSSVYPLGIYIYLGFTVLSRVVVRLHACTALHCAAFCMCSAVYVCAGMYVCMEEAGSWTNIPSCLSFLRYVLCKHHGPWYKLLARDLRRFPSLVFTEYPSQILSAWCQCHVCTVA